jgi:diguanylate cyclase (GGDEF)-like protein/PAS domain S-box-containing protein
MSATIDRLRFQVGKESPPESHWRAFLDKVRAYSKKVELELCSLRENREQLLAIVDLIPVAFFVKDHKSRFFLMNHVCEEQWGLSFADLRDTDASHVFPPEQMEHFLSTDRMIFEGRQPVEFEETFWSVAKQNNRIGYTFKRPMYDANGDPQYLVCVTLDITERKAAEAQLRESEERFRTVFHSVNDGIIVLDADTSVFLDVNPQICQMFGYSREKFLTLDLGDLSTGISPYTLEGAQPLLERVSAGESVVFEWHCKTNNGHRFWVEVSIRRAAYGGRAILLSTTRDITARKQANDRVVYMARHDVLTGLVNRSVFVEVLDQAIARVHRGARTFAVLYLDLDHFKDVNDTLGHPVGDLLLRAVADRLRASVRATDTVARFGGDEFAIILSDIQNPADAAIVSGRILDVISEPIAIQDTCATIATKILRAFSETFLIGSNEIRSGTSIGISVFGAESADAEAMLAHADVALYRAKSEGRGSYRYFTDTMDTEVRARVALEKELHEAIRTDQFFLEYQPQVEIDTGRLVGLEALVRWNHPTRGIIGPGRFIPVAERNGVIVPLGRWVMREACRQIKLWLGSGITPPVIAINLSGVQFKNAARLEKDIAAALTESGLPARVLELELTESVLMETSRDNNDLLLRLRKGGHRIAIDDFGSGYSSLGYLRRFPVDRIKIAQTFVADIGAVSGDDAIVRAALGLARELDIQVVLEGVETAAQIALLKTWGAQIVQGHYFARALPVPDVTALLRVGKVTPTLEG